MIYHMVRIIPCHQSIHAIDIVDAIARAYQACHLSILRIPGYADLLDGGVDDYRWYMAAFSSIASIIGHDAAADADWLVLP